MEKVSSFEKLSQLQKLILVALCEPRYALLKRRELAQRIKGLYFGKDSGAIRAALSRSLRRLEERGYLIGSQGRWQLTNTEQNPHDNGLILAFLVWSKNREFYARLGLKGPPLEALGIKQKAAARRGIEVELDFLMLESSP